MYYDEKGQKVNKQEIEKVCPECHSNQLGQISYININNDKVLDTFEPTTLDDVYRCFECGEGVDYDEIQLRTKKGKLIVVNIGKCKINPTLEDKW